MKKFGVFIICLFLLSFVSAANDSGQVGMDLQQAGQQIAKNGASVFSSQVQIPAGLQGFAKLFFGFDNTTTFDVFIIIIMVWIVLFIFMIYLMSFIPLFNKSKAIRWISSLIITLLIGISGGIKEGAYFFLNLGGILNFLDSWPIIKFLIAVVILFIIFLAFTKIMRFVRMKMELDTAENTGRDLAVGSVFAKIFAKSGEELGKRD